MSPFLSEVYVIDLSDQAEEALVSKLEACFLKTLAYSRDADAGMEALKTSIEEQHSPAFCLVCLGDDLPDFLEEYVTYIQVELNFTVALMLRDASIDTDGLLWQHCIVPILAEDMPVAMIRGLVAGLINTSKLKEQFEVAVMLEGSIEERIEEGVLKRTRKLEENLDFLENLVDSIPLPIFYKDIDGKILGCNRSFGHYIGRLSHELVGLKTSDIMADEMTVKFDFYDEEIHEDGISRSYEEQVKYVDDSERFILFEKAAFYNSEGAMKGTIGLMLDITDRKKAEESLNNEHRLLRTVIDLIPESIYAKDRNCRFILANLALCELVGKSSPDQIIGKADADFFPVDVWAPYYSSEAKILNTGESLINKEERCINLTTGEHRWLRTTKVPLRNSVGIISGIVGIGRDITHRKVLEDQLLELKNIVNHSRTVAFLIRADEEMTVEFVSDNVEQFGFTSEDIMSSECSYRDLIVEEDRQGVVELIENNISISFHEFAHQYRINTPMGTPCWVEDHTYIRTDEHGNVTHYQCVVSDISWKKKAEEEKNRLELQLRQAQKLEAIGELAAGIAHEINTPIQFIGDNSRFLLDSTTDLFNFIQTAKGLNTVSESDDVSETIEDLKSIAEDIDLDYLIEEIPAAINQNLEGVQRVSSIVLAMKEFSHPGSKERQAIHINKAIENTITVARNEWKYCAEMKTELAEDLPLVSVYAGKVNQVLLNLLVNAAHAIIARQKAEEDNSLGRITIRSRLAGDRLVIEVEDSGSGIPDSIKDRIFDPFFTTKEVGKGTGQGLAIAYDVIVRNHNGKLYFKSQEGKGTTFFVELPILQPSLQNDENDGTPSSE